MTELEREKEVLERRARELARVPEPPPPPGEVLSVVIFSLSAERYGIEARLVREVARLQELVQVPATPAHLAGVTNLRGEIVPVVSLRPLLGLASRGLTDLSRLVVLGDQEPDLALIADDVEEIREVRKDALFDPPGPVSAQARRLLLGVAADALAVLDGEALLRDPRLFFSREQGQEVRTPGGGDD